MWLLHAPWVPFVVILATAAFATREASAQQPLVPVAGQPAAPSVPEPPPRWQPQADISAALVTGDTGLASLDLVLLLNRTTANDALKIKGETTFTRALEHHSTPDTPARAEATVGQYAADVRWHRQVAPNSGAFWVTHGSWGRNVDQGLAGRTVASVGPGATIRKTAKDTLSIDVRGAAISETVLGPDNRFLGAASSLNYQRTLSATTQYTGSLEFVQSLAGADDHQLELDHVLTAPVSKRVGLRVAFHLLYDHKPAPLSFIDDEVIDAASGLNTRLAVGFSINL